MRISLLYDRYRMGDCNRRIKFEFNDIIFDEIDSEQRLSISKYHKIYLLDIIIRRSSNLFYC